MATTAVKEDKKEKVFGGTWVTGIIIWGLNAVPPLFRDPVINSNDIKIWIIILIMIAVAGPVTYRAVYKNKKEI